MLKEQKYKINQRVEVCGWVRNDFGRIVDIKEIYHHRSYEYTWGYKINYENDGAGLVFIYVPEGYLRKAN